MKVRVTLSNTGVHGHAQSVVKIKIKFPVMLLVFDVMYVKLLKIVILKYELIYNYNKNVGYNQEEFHFKKIVLFVCINIA